MTQDTKPTIYYIKQNEQLRQKIAMLQKIIAELTAQDTGPLPFATLPEGE